MVGPSSEVVARVLDSGWMELAVPGSQLVCDESGTATWIALCRADWDLGDAAVTLADLWDTDPWSVRDMMLSWIDEFVAAGVVEP
jgi:hypothetical protein